MQSAISLESVLKRDRVVVAFGVIAVVAIAWGHTVYVAQKASAMDLSTSMAMVNMRSWSVGDFALMFVMWAVMMVAMMLPSAAPMILLFAAVNRKRRENAGPFVPTSVFVSGYVVAWSVFAAAATMGTWGLHQASLLSSMMGESTSAYLGGGLLIAAGAFQWTRLKYACLTHCRSPLSFLMNGWREGNVGAFKMGLEYGKYCLGCCWILMGLLFVLGIMNLLWIAALAGFVLLEKLAPAGQRVGRIAGVLLMAWGAWAIVVTNL
jgi:predicted metal-binding membrane protein